MRTKVTRNYSGWLHLGFYGGLQRATVVVFGMLSTMVLAHKAIDPSEMGVWSLFLIIAAFVEIIRHGLVKNSVIKYLNSSQSEEKNLVLSSALILNVIITILLGIVLVAFAKSIATYTKAPQLEGMIYWYVLALVSLIPFSQLEWIMLGRLQFKQLFWTYVVRQAVILFLQAGCVLIGIRVSLNMLVIFYAAGIFLGALSGYSFIRSSLNFKFAFSKQWMKRLWNFGKYAFGTGVSNIVFRSTDSFMVSNILASTVIVAEQGIALRVFNLIDIPSQLIGDIIFPKSSGVDPTNKERIKSYYEKSVGATLSIILPAILVVILIPKIPILILAGPKYLDAVPYLRLLMLVSIFLAFLKQFGTIVDSTGHPETNFILTTGIALLNLASCFFFINHFAFIGAAYGLIATHVVSFVVTQWILYKRYNIQFWNSFKYAFSFYPEIGKLLYTKFALR
jgi:O-antigen/teichoic acid export membrane protein